MNYKQIHHIYTLLVILTALYPYKSFPRDDTELVKCVMPPPEHPDSPWDYRTRKDKYDLVERRHFTPKVENLIHGESTDSIAGDIGYTLDKFPNHLRALASLIRYSERTKRTTFPHTPYSVECYLKRAVYFKEDDLLVRLLYTSYLVKHGKNTEASTHLDYIEATENKSPLINYNLGLLYFDLKNFEKSYAYAEQAYADGITLPGLKNKLISAKQWREPRPKTQN